jgi:hypothetical protein
MLTISEPDVSAPRVDALARRALRASFSAEAPVRLLAADGHQYDLLAAALETLTDSWDELASPADAQRLTIEFVRKGSDDDAMATVVLEVV